MFLSRLFLDTAKRATMKALACPEHLHGAIESAFSGDRRHPLWRLDDLNGSKVLLILSRDIPDLTLARQQFGFESMPQETRDYNPLLDKAVEGSLWHFRLTANPTYSAPNPNGRGIVCAHTTPEHQLQWLVRQGEKNGFSVEPDAVRVGGSRWNRFYKGHDGNRKVTFLSVTYEGTLRVTDEAAFRRALTEGIGRGKAYGMGLMTLVRFHE